MKYSFHDKYCELTESAKDEKEAIEAEAKMIQSVRVNVNIRVYFENLALQMWQFLFLFGMTSCEAFQGHML